VCGGCFGSDIGISDVSLGSVSIVYVWGGVGAVGGFGLDIGLCRLLVAVSLLCFSCVCVRWFGSDSGLHRLLVAVNLCCFSCVCACVGVDQIAGLVSY